MALKKTEAPTEEEKEKDYSFAYGGWVTSYYWHFKNLDNDSDNDEWVSDMTLQDLRLWARADLYQTFIAYGRMQYYHAMYQTSADYAGKNDGIYGPYVDMLYVKCDLMSRFKIPFEATVGRQYLKLGRGIAYNDVHDGIYLKADPIPEITFQTFGSRNKPHDHNIDYSVPGYKRKQRRWFWGSEVAYKGLNRHVFYSYYLLQRDSSGEKPEDPAQKYRYQSQYCGAGVSGMPTDNFTYWGEIIKGNGYTFTDVRRGDNIHRKSSIDSWAYNVGGKYRFDLKPEPVFELETAYGSGDRDRASVTNTIGGNIYKDDNNFSYFGAYYSGYALMPRLSNIYIHKAACSFKPFKVLPVIDNIKEIAVGGKYYFYHKDRSAGGIYDDEATLKEKYVGQEVNLYLYWKIYHNLFYSMRYGLFFPGSAYPKETDAPSTYFFARMTMTF